MVGKRGRRFLPGARPHSFAAIPFHMEPVGSFRDALCTSRKKFSEFHGNARVAPADVRRFGYVINKDGVLGTHRA